MEIATALFRFSIMNDKEASNFGDMLGLVMSSLPPEASSKFLQALSGLTADESSEVCKYVHQLKPEKKFRVIQAMADSNVDGKRKFMISLRKKFAIEDKPTPLTAAARVKQFATEGNKFHSSHALVQAKTKQELKQQDFVQSRNAKSSSDLVTDQEIRDMGKMLYKAHIGQKSSEYDLKLLEQAISRPSIDPLSEAAVAFAKRERPKSNWELIKNDQSAERKQKSSTTSVKVLTPTSVRRSSATSSIESNEDVPTTKRWTKSQDEALRASVRYYGEKNWKAIAERVPGRNHAQCLQRWRKVLKPGLVKGHWAYEEDQILEALVRQGCNNWGRIAEQIPGRTPKQCRERWRNHLDPSINKGPYHPDEDAIILEAQERLGNKWSQISQLLKGRTEDSVKIRWKSLKQNPTKAQSGGGSGASGSSRNRSNYSYQTARAPDVTMINGVEFSPAAFEPAFFNYKQEPYHHPLPPPSIYTGYSTTPSSLYSAADTPTSVYSSSPVYAIKREQQQPQPMNMFLNEPNVDDLEDLVNSVKDLTDGGSFDFRFDQDL